MKISFFMKIFISVDSVFKELSNGGGVTANGRLVRKLSTTKVARKKPRN
jgi:hypothetical protein